MTREEAKVFCDKVVGAINTLAEMNGQNGIETCSISKNFNIYSGIFVLANALDAELKRKWIGTGFRYPVRVYFEYDGVEFFENCAVKTKEPDDVYELELELKDEEQTPFDDTDSTPEIFKGMQKAVDDFDSATSNIHAELDSLGQV